MRRAMIRSLLMASSLIIVASGRSFASPVVELTVESAEQGGSPVVRSLTRDLVQSAETINARSNETVEVLFADGTSVAVAQGGTINIEKYSYDAASRLGELSIRVSSGLVRVIGGILNNSGLIDVEVEGGRIEIDNGVVFIEARDGRTEAVLTAGRSLRVIPTKGEAADLGPRQVVILQTDGGLSVESKQDPEEVKRLAIAMNPGLVSGKVPSFVSDGSFNGEKRQTAEKNKGPDSSSTRSAAEAAQVQDINLSGGNGCPGCSVTLYDNPLSDPAVGNRNATLSTNLPAADWSIESRQSPDSNDHVFSGDGIRTSTIRSFDNSLSRTFQSNGPSEVQRPIGSFGWLRLGGVLGAVLSDFDTQNGSNHSSRNPATYLQWGWSDNLDGQIVHESFVTLLQDSETGLNITTGTGCVPGPGCLDGDVESYTNTGTRDVASLYANLGELNSFLAVEGRGASSQTGQIRPVRTFFATGTVSGVGFEVQDVVDSFAIHPGLLDWATSDDDAVIDGTGRAFLRPLENPYSLYSSQLKILTAAYDNRAYPDINESIGRALHFDFGISGESREQRSTISVTLGEIKYKRAGDLNYNPMTAQLRGRTLGSVSDGAGSLAVNSPIFSTAAGGGNPDAELNANSGRAQYLVLENFDENISTTGGIEQPVSGDPSDSSNYAFLRIAEATSTNDADLPVLDQNLQGYIGGLVERDGLPGVTAANSDDLQILLQDGNVGASGNLEVRGASGLLTSTVRLGLAGIGQDLLSAQTGTHEFAAISASAPNLTSSVSQVAASAIVSGRDMVDGWVGVDGTELESTLRGYQHLEWGFFFGDLVATNSITSESRDIHGHLLSFVAGTTSVDPLPSGKAEYSGHVLANVQSTEGADTRVYTAAGSIRNEWDFGRRTGSGRIEMDGQSYQVVTRMENESSSRFAGGIVGSQSGRTGQLEGVFIDSLAGDSHAGMIGGFSISSAAGGDASPAYSAVGTFGAERDSGN